MRDSMVLDEENENSSMKALITNFEFFVWDSVEKGLRFHITSDIVKWHGRKRLDWCCPELGVCHQSIYSLSSPQITPRVHQLKSQRLRRRVMGKVVLDYTTINVFPAYLLNYNKYECNQDFCGKIPNKYPLFVEMQLPNPKKAHHEDPTTSHYCTQRF